MGIQLLETMDCSLLGSSAHEITGIIDFLAVSAFPEAG